MSDLETDEFEGWRQTANILIRLFTLLTLTAILLFTIVFPLTHLVFQSSLTSGWQRWISIFIFVTAKAPIIILWMLWDPLKRTQPANRTAG